MILNFRRRKKKKRKRKSARFVWRCIMTRCSLTVMTLTCGSITPLHGKNLKHCKSNLTSGLLIYIRYYYIAGSAIVLGIIAVCLFPLWPMEMRQGLGTFMIKLLMIHIHLFQACTTFLSRQQDFWFLSSSSPS